LGISGVVIALVAVFTGASMAFLWLGFVVAGVGASLAFYVKWGRVGGVGRSDAGLIADVRECFPMTPERVGCHPERE
jgi:hypothetical protein